MWSSFRRPITSPATATVGNRADPRNHPQPDRARLLLDDLRHRSVAVAVNGTRTAADLSVDVTLAYAHLRSLLRRAEAAGDEETAVAVLNALGALRPVVQVPTGK